MCINKVLVLFCYVALNFSIYSNMYILIANKDATCIDMQECYNVIV